MLGILRQSFADGLKDGWTVASPLDMADERRLERLSAMLRRRGVVLPAFDIYGGVSGLIDYGPVVAGRLTQWESATFTRWKSLVQIQYRPPLLPEPLRFPRGGFSLDRERLTLDAQVSVPYHRHESMDAHGSNDDRPSLSPEVESTVGRVGL